MQPRFISNRGQKQNVDSTISLACETLLSKSRPIEFNTAQ